MTFKNQHFLSVEQLSLEKMELIFQLASKLEDLAQGVKITSILKGAVLANLFFEPSTRTRMSFEVAFKLLGGSVINVLETGTSSLVKGESLHDMSRVVSGYADVIAMRHPQEDSIRDFANAATVPLINGGNGTGEHPTQALVDLYTIFKETCDGDFNRFQNLKICLVGDLKHGRTVHSLMKALSFFKSIEFTLVSPPSLKPPSSLVEALKVNDKIIETDDLKTGVANADVIYMTRIQEERFTSIEEFNQHVGAYSINKNFYEQHCQTHTKIMHPMPRDSRLQNPEIAHDLNEHPNLAMFRQSANAISVRMSLFCLIFGIEHKVFECFEEPLY